MSLRRPKLLQSQLETDTSILLCFNRSRAIRRLVVLVTGRDGEGHSPCSLCGEVAHDDINQVRQRTGWEDCYSINSVVAVEVAVIRAASSLKREIRVLLLS